MVFPRTWHRDIWYTLLRRVQNSIAHTGQGDSCNAPSINSQNNTLQPLEEHLPERMLAKTAKNPSMPHGSFLPGAWRASAVR